jgi:hypothetical protein
VRTNGRIVRIEIKPKAYLWICWPFFPHASATWAIAYTWTSAAWTGTIRALLHDLRRTKGQILLNRTKPN